MRSPPRVWQSTLVDPGGASKGNLLEIRRPLRCHPRSPSPACVYVVRATRRRGIARIQADIDTALDPLRTQDADRGEDLRAMRREVTALEAQMDEYGARLAQLDEAVATGGGGGGGGVATAGPAMPPARGQRTVDDGSRAAPQDDVARTLYNGAYNDYLRDNYELCISGFEEYLRLYPTSARAANSQYWIGVCHREQGRPQQARRAFQQVIADYPSNDLAADAMFNDALILRELGRTDDAAETFARRRTA